MAGHKARVVIRPEIITPIDCGWHPTERRQDSLPTAHFHGLSNTRRSGSQPDPILLRELTVVIALVAIGMRILPHPLDFWTASVLPPVYVLTRIAPSLLTALGLLGYLALIGVPFLPALITREPADLGLAMVSLLFTIPILAWLETWRSPGLWDVFDRLFIAFVPFAVPFFVVVIVRLFDVGALSWN
jgi:hypothetical protein